ncbi:hypothetical protein FO519_005717 [Halicephalobus sp. NKZ332]|nr:hypothetical protein FO519_005717 [Halicephalobus sp. NKZ332]
MIRLKTSFFALILGILLILQFPVQSWQRTAKDNCKSEKLREVILESVGMYPHQFSFQAKHMKQQAEQRFGNWWSSVIISEKGGYGMSAIYDQFQNTSCELMILDAFYWLGRTC